jgi:hypothetical protein
MELAEILRALRARWYVVVLVVVAAAGVAVAAKRSVRSVATGTATVQMLVDSPQSALTDLRQDPAPLVARATVFAQLMTTNSVLKSVASQAGVQPGDLTAEGPYSGAGQGLNVETPSAARGIQIVAAKSLYHLAFVAQPTLPIVTVSVQGPSPVVAARVASAVVPGVLAWLAPRQLSQQINPGSRVTIRQLGTAQAGVVNSSSGRILAGAAGAGTLILGLLVLLGIEGRRARQLSVVGPLPARWDGAGSEPARAHTD